MNITVDLNILHGAAAPSSAVFAKNEREASSFSIQEKKKKKKKGAIETNDFVYTD